MQEPEIPGYDQDPTREHTKRETDKKCPSCGGTMAFDPATGGLACPYCGKILGISMEGGALSAQEQDFALAEQTGNVDWGAGKKTVICQSCGAESIYDTLQISDECPYCGSNHVMEEKGRDTLAPGGVCVFKLDRKQAGARFKSWIKRKIFCPKAAKEKAKPDSFQGVYLPYWTFDAQTHSSYSARYGRTRVVRDKDGRSRTVTDWYNTNGTYAEFINDKPSLATVRHDRGILSTIEPFDTENNLTYRPEYIAGFIAERYSIGLAEGWEKAKDQIKSFLHGKITSKIRADHRADRVTNLHVNTVYEDIKYKYLMLPVWISSFKYKNRIYEFMVNGQTGKVGGKAPVSALRVLISIVLGIALVALFIWLFNAFSGIPLLNG
jgi:predicted RNA-binding Zn-ribbon protein involved in translation (DUF1610 family)